MKMMIKQHPITPPLELVHQWADMLASRSDQAVFTMAAQWGGDQELEACVEWLGDAPVVYNDNGDLHPGSYLRDARRPKPPSLKEQALAALEDDDIDVYLIRRALEALPND
jgi:hypothetical protein